MLEARNFYIVKQTDGTLWNFTSKENFGIIYRTFDNKLWSNYNILVKNASKAFSALILPDNRICIIYQSTSGNLLLKVYYENEWTEYSILHKKGNGVNDIHFKTLYASDKIQIFYSIQQSHENMRTLFHQTLTLNDELKVSSPVLIDTTNVNHVNQFVVHALEDNTICIMYQKFLNKYELGYKIFNTNNPNWSKFCNVDKNISPYTDYSLCSVSGKLNILYIKNTEQSSTLYNFREYLSRSEHTKVAESNNLISCALFKEGTTTYRFWISNKYLYSYFTNDMGDSISKVKSEGLKSMNIFKASFIEISSDKRYVSNEVFIQDGVVLTIIPNNFLNYRNILNAEQNKVAISRGSNAIINNLTTNHVKENHIINTEEKIASVESRLVKKDQIISQLNYIIKEEKNKVILLSNKISILEKNYLQWENEKSQLYKDISLLQEEIILKESQIHEGVRIRIEKETKLMELSKLNSIIQDQNKKNVKIESETEIEEYKMSIINLNKTIESLNFKIGILEGEIVALLNEKANSSLLKKIFGS